MSDYGVSQTYDYEKFKSYLEGAGASETTKKSYLWAFKKFYGRLDTQENFNSWLGTYMRGSRANPFYRGFYSTLNKCFKLEYVIPHSMLKLNLKDDQLLRKRKFLSHQEVQKMIKNTSPYISLLIRIYFDTGLRLRELINTETENIDTVSRTIKGIGKNRKPFSVKMSSETAWRLEDWLIEHEQKYPFHVRNCSDHAKSYWYFLKKECALIGIEGVTPHKLRHALAYYLRAEKSFDLEQIRVKMRHKMLETTKIYAAAPQEEVDTKMDREVFNEED
jgi:integrase